MGWHTDKPACARCNSGSASVVSDAGSGTRNLQLQYLEHTMNSIVYIVGLVVIVLAALSFFGLR